VVTAQSICLPETIKPMSGELAERIGRLVEGVSVSQNESPGGESPL
jgi:hypothetical protein